MEVLASVAGLVSEEDDMQRILNVKSEEELLRIFEEAVEA
jgi:PTS system mannitol-specific IIA component